MNSHDETIIEIDRRKIALGIAGTLAFVVIGIWLVMLDDSRIATSRGFRLFMNSPLLAHVLGVLAILFFGGVAIFLIKKIFDRKPGLVFNSEGLVDNAGATAAGLIPWDEIEGYQVLEISRQKMLIVMVSDPDKYVARGNALRRKLNAANYNMAGSPISISTRTLKTSFDELVFLFRRYHTKYARPDDRMSDAASF
jgi:hypothetical protein